MAFVRRCARPMLAAVFVTGGYDQLRNPNGRAGLAARFVNRLAELTGLPDDPEMAVRANGAIMLAGGSLLAADRAPRLASLMLAAALIPTTVVGHDYWNRTDEAVAARDRVQFFKNLGLLGGLVLSAAATDRGPGRHACIAAGPAAGASGPCPS